MADTDETSSKITAETVSPFLSNLKSKLALAQYAKHVIVCHNDADGLCAGVLAQAFFPNAEFIAVSHPERPKFHGPGTLYLYVDIQPLLNPEKVPENVFCIDHHSLTVPSTIPKGEPSFHPTIQNENYFIYDSKDMDEDTVSTATLLVEFIAYASGAVDYKTKGKSLKDFGNDKLWKQFEPRKEHVLCGAVTDNAQHLVEKSEKKRLKEWFSGEETETIRDYSLAISLCLGDPDLKKRVSMLGELIKKSAGAPLTELGSCIPAEMMNLAKGLMEFIEGTLVPKISEFYIKKLRLARENYFRSRKNLEKAKEKYYENIIGLLQNLRLQYDDKDVPELGVLFFQGAATRNEFRSRVKGILRSLMQESGREPPYNAPATIEHYLQQNLDENWHVIRKCEKEYQSETEFCEKIVGVSENWRKTPAISEEIDEITAAIRLVIEKIGGYVRSISRHLKASAGGVENLISLLVEKRDLSQFDFYVDDACKDKQKIRAKLEKRFKQLNELDKDFAKSSLKLKAKDEEFFRRQDVIRTIDSYLKEPGKSLEAVCVYLTPQKSEQIRGIMSSYLYFHGFNNIVVEPKGSIATWGARGYDLNYWIDMISTLNISDTIEEVHADLSATMDARAVVSKAGLMNTIKGLNREVSTGFRKNLLENLIETNPETEYGGRGNAFGGKITGTVPRAFSQMDPDEAKRILSTIGANGNFKWFVSYIYGQATAWRHMAVLAKLKAKHFVTVHLKDDIFTNKNEVNTKLSPKLFICGKKDSEEAKDA